MQVIALALQCSATNNVGWQWSKMFVGCVSPLLQVSGLGAHNDDGDHDDDGGGGDFADDDSHTL